MKDPLLGRTIAHRYRLISQLGSGRFASVYLARHVLIARLCAIKIVYAEQAALEQEEDKVRAKAAELTAKLDDLENEPAKTGERLDAALADENARLEGRAFALRTPALDAWLALEEIADLSGITRVVLSIPPAVSGPPA